MGFFDDVGNGLGKAWDSVGNFIQGQGQVNAQQALERGQQYNYVGANPYQGNWNDLIGQLRQSAAGAGPSLAQMQYQQASNDALHQQLAMAQAGRSPGMAMQASNNMGQIGQGMAQGAAQARLQEQMANRQALAQALGMAGQADFQRQAANQNAYVGILGAQMQQPSTFDQLATIGSQGLMGYAMLNRGSGGK
jgi:hypothetical protein